MSDHQRNLGPVDHASAQARWSPNFGERRDGHQPSILVLHYTGMADGESAQSWLCDPQSNVSSHYLVHEDGCVVQMVPESMRAWHAGQGSWHGQQDINSRSIGIEIVNPGHPGGLPEFPEVQIGQLIDLMTGIIGRHKIDIVDVIGHSDMAPGRKIDPGEKFPWHTLAEAGVAVFVEPEPITGGRFFALGDAGQPVEALQSMLALYGFDQPVDGVFDERTKAQIESFQMRQRPAKVDGVADVSTIKTLRDFLAVVTDHRRRQRET